MAREIKQVVFPGSPLPNLTRVAAYARVSTAKDAMLHSLSAQVSYYSNMIQANPDWLYCGVYADEGLTGTKEKRPEFLRLLDDCRAGKIDLILVKSISRFARNTVTLLETVRELKALGVNVFFEEQNIQTGSVEGELMMTILASYAQEESLSVSENMKWKIRKNFENGIPWNGTVFGYRLVNGRYEVKPDEAAVIRLIYDLYLDGHGYESIAKMLNEKKLKNRAGREWKHVSVMWILHNYSYTGNLILQSTYVENHITKKYRVNRGEYPMYRVEGSHEAIIPLDDFEAVQEESRRRAAKFKKLENMNLTAYTGRVFCGNCGGKCRRKTRHGKPIWICNTSNMQGKAVCAAKAVPESVLDDLESKYAAEKYILCDSNRITAVLANGDSIIETWQQPSRSESWTDEKRKAQGERMKKIWNEK